GREQGLHQLVFPHGVPAADTPLLGHLGQVALTVRIQCCWGHQRLASALAVAAAWDAQLLGRMPWSEKPWGVSIVHDGRTIAQPRGQSLPAEAVPERAKTAGLRNQQVLPAI